MPRPARAACLVMALSCVVGVVCPATASWCGPTQPVCVDFWKADAVFVGRVVDIEPEPPRQPDAAVDSSRPDAVRVSSEPFRKRAAVVEVLEAFRGLGGRPAGSRIDVDIWVLNPGSEPYIFYARREQGRLTVRACERTRPVSRAGEDLAYARALAASTATRARVYGALHWQIQPQQVGPERPADPLPTATVTLIGEGLEVRLTTDTDGLWETRLPPGTYRAHVDLPAAYAGGGDRGTFTIDDPRACQQLDVTIDWNGRLRGRVVDAAGRPLAGVDVHCTSPGQGRPFWVPRFTRTDDDGRFRFAGLERGQQEVRIGIQLMAPGATSTDDVTQLPIVRPLEFAPAQEIDLGTVALSPAVRTTTVRGTVVDANGKPVPGAMLFMGATTEDAGFPDARTDAEGRYVFAAIPGRRYVVELISIDADTVTTPPFVAGEVAGPPPIVAPKPR